MKRKKMFLCCMAVILFFPGKTFALNCPYDQLSKLKSIATNIRYDYSYREIDGKVSFQIRLVNLNPAITIKDVYHNNVFSYTDSNEIIIDNFPDGGTYRFEMSATNSIDLPSVYYLNEVVNGILVQTPIEVAQIGDCDNINIYNLYVTVPSYNPYYSLEICNNSFSKLCEKWNQHSLTKEKFIEQVKKDDEQLQKKTKKAISSKSWKDIIIDWYNQNYIYVWSGTILILIFIIYLYKNRESGFEGW